MVTATKTKQGDRVEAAEAELAGARRGREGLEERLESANQAQADLERRRQEEFAAGKDTTDLDSQLSKAERDTSDLKKMLEDAQRQEAEGEERCHAAQLRAAKVMELRLRLRQLEATAAAHEFIEQAAQKAEEELRVMHELQVAAAEVGRLSGQHSYSWGASGLGSLVRMADRLRVEDGPECQRSLQDVRRQLQDAEAGD